MAVLFAWLFSLALRMIVSLRYRIQVRGWDNVVDSKPPILFLPNHPGFIDPVLIFSILFRQFRPRLIVFEGNFPRLIRVLLVRLLRVVEVPDLSRPSQEARQRTEGAVAEVIAGLRRGESFILWPSGRVQRDGVERLGSVRALTDLLVAVPNATVVAIRTRGIWGSMFSFARTGKLPELGPCLVRGALILASNLALLTPRRPVSITLEEIDRNRLPKLDRELVNRWFEDWPVSCAASRAATENGRASENTRQSSICSCVKRAMNHSTACEKTAAARVSTAGAQAARSNSGGSTRGCAERPGFQTTLRSPAV